MTTAKALVGNADEWSSTDPAADRVRTAALLGVGVKFGTPMECVKLVLAAHDLGLQVRLIPADTNAIKRARDE